MVASNAVEDLYIPSIQANYFNFSLVLNIITK